MPTRSLGRKEDTHAEVPTVQSELQAKPRGQQLHTFLPQQTKSNVSRDRVAKEEIQATGSKILEPWEGRGKAGHPAWWLFCASWFISAAAPTCSFFGFKMLNQGKAQLEMAR
jgi:hypothetical protein